MRVTKTVREYIEKKVAEKVNVKYEVEKLEAKRQKDAVEEFTSELERQMNEYAKMHITKFIEQHPYAEKGMRKEFVSLHYGAIQITDKHMSSSVHNWQNRAYAEIKEKVDDIIVTLELGGTKADLERMISEI